MEWVTRERPKIDRIACPWLILRFIDSQAQFRYVPADEVLRVATQTGAIPYDIPGVELTHVGERTLHLSLGFSRKEIGRRGGRQIARERRERPSSIELGEFSQTLLEGIKASVEFLVIRSAIEQLDERCVLFGRVGLKGKNMRAAGDRPDLTSLLLEEFSRSGRLRQHVDAISQQSRARGLQGAPNPHPKCLVRPRQVGNEQKPGGRILVHVVDSTEL